MLLHLLHSAMRQRHLSLISRNPQKSKRATTKKGPDAFVNFHKPKTPAQMNYPQMPLPEQPGKAIGAEKTPEQSSEKETKEIRNPPKSAPVPMTSSAQKKEKEEAPPSSGWSIGKWIAKKINPDATYVDSLGEDNKAYYDEKLKRWIFPGDDPSTVVTELPPPPTMPIPKKEPTGTQDTTKTPSKADPLASLMAPPPGRTPQHTGQGGLADLMAPPRVARSHFSEPRVSRSASRLPNANVPASARKPAADPGLKPPAPHFVIFQAPPVAKPSEEKSED